jgi:hypothetical protein
MLGRIEGNTGLYQHAGTRIHSRDQDATAIYRGCEGLVPADRFFGAAPEVKKTLQARVAANALELARHGLPKAPFYLTGQAPNMIGSALK